MSTSMSSHAARLVWWLVRCIPWYLWLVLGAWVYLKWNGAGKRAVEPRRSRRVAEGAEGTPRRPTANPKQPTRPASPHAGSRSSTPHITRRNSYARSSDYGRSNGPEMTERRTSGSPAYSPAPRSPAPSSRAGSDRQAYSAGSAPQSYTSERQLRRPASSSKLRQSVTASEAPPSSARKRGHADADQDADATVKRSKLSEAYTFDDSDEDSKPMELDESALSRGTKRDEAALSDEEPSAASKRSKQGQADPRKSSKKRRASPSPPLSGSEDEAAPRQDKKKARTDGRGAGGMRDKRGIDDVSFEAEYETEGEDLATNGARNADSDFSDDEVEAGAGSESTEHTVGSDSRAGSAPSRVKRFRGRVEREGTDDEDMMGDDLDADTAAALSSPPVSNTKSKKLSSVSTPKKRLSSRAAAAARKAASTLSASGSATKKAARRLSTSSSTPRKIGEEWTNYEGDRYRIDEDGQQRRLVEVREVRRKYKLPADSKHPDAKATHEVVVERWVTGDEYAALLEQRKLAWQPSREEEERERARAAAASEENVADTSMRDGEEAAVSPAVSKERGIYYTSGVGTPLRTHSGLASRVASPSSLNKASNSPAAYSSLASGRLRMPSSASNSRLAALAAGSPARSWSASQAKRLVEDEQAARAERERRRKASIMLGGEDEVKAVETNEEPDAKKHKGGEEAKIKLSDFGLGAPPVVAEAKTAAPALATASAPKVEPTASKSGVPNFFGGLGNVDAKSTAATEAPATKPTSSVASFSFGSKPADSTAKQEQAPKPTAESPAPKPSFNFGAAPSAPTQLALPAPAVSEGKKDETPKPAFSFGTAPSGATASPAPQQNQDASKASFSFGASAATPSETKKDDPAPAPPAASPFSFGAPAQPEAPKPAAPAPSFSFGAPVAAEPAKHAAPSFSFGGATTQADKPATPAAPSFSFGATTPATEKPATPSAPSFSFGASAPPVEKSAAAPSFSFGNSASAAPPQPAASSTASPFSFGAPTSQSAAAPAASTGFSFGQPVSSTPTPGTAPSTPGFSFGTAAPAPAAASAGFTFGAPAAPGGSAPLFSPGLPGGDDNTTGTPRRRPIRRMPGR